MNRAKETHVQITKVPKRVVRIPCKKWLAIDLQQQPEYGSLWPADGAKERYPLVYWRLQRPILLTRLRL